MTETQRHPAWWADAGPDDCEFCSATYYVEIGYHCATCDRPICPCCAVAVFEWRMVVCPECGASSGEA